MLSIAHPVCERAAVSTAGDDEGRRRQPRIQCPPDRRDFGNPLAFSNRAAKYLMTLCAVVAMFSKKGEDFRRVPHFAGVQTYGVSGGKRRSVVSCW
jgi:hypothetical protein